MSKQHGWRFFRSGGFDQVRIDQGMDLANLHSLDQKLWVALGCPSSGLEFDSKTLELIDTDKDGRIRAPELLAAVAWAIAQMKNPDELVKPSATLPLGAINDALPEGRSILESARQILVNLGKSEADSISVTDTTDTVKIFAQTKFNGDGIVPAEAADDEGVAKVIQDMVACVGGETDRSGKPGVSQAKVDQFLAEAQAFSDWHGKAEEGAASILPLGDATAGAFAALQAVRAKVDDYFARCRLAAFDERAVAALNRLESDYLNVAAQDFSIDAKEVSHFPLARVQAGRGLPLKAGVNPAWAEAVAALQAKVVQPLLGAQTELSEEQWGKICGQFAGYQGWMSAKAGGMVETLGLARVREILGGKFKEAIAALLAKDKALEPQANAIAAVDKLARFQRDLVPLLNNFVSFRDFYGRRTPAIFQAGTLYLDGRSCELCLRVEDMAKHGTMAAASYCYLAYCDCVRKSTGEKMTIAAAFTGGDSDFLMPGRNGLFYDRKGRDWDATVTKIVDNPISIRQAFWSPYKRVARMIEGQIEKMAASRDKAMTDKASAGVAEAGKKVEESKTAAQQAFDVAKFAGIFAAIGLALGAIGAVLTAVVKGFFGLAMWQMPLAVGGALLLISGPSMLLAFMKLRKRNLGPILDANGWAINARARINVPFGASLTALAKLPTGSSRSTHDDYAQKSSLKPYIILVLVVAYIFLGFSYENGRMHRWTKGRFGKPAPVQVSPPPEAPAPAAEGAPAKP